MNIFFVDRDPFIAAKMLPDVYTGGPHHGGKMIVESCQMLANAYSKDKLKLAPLTIKGTVRKHSYLHHPCSKWVLLNKANFNWLLRHADSMLNEKIFRTGKVTTNPFIDWCLNNEPDHYGCDYDYKFTDPPMCMPEKYRTTDVVQSYRDYLVKGKGHISFTWSVRGKPEWWPETPEDSRFQLASTIAG